MADAGLHVVHRAIGAHAGAEVLGASVWPIEQMSSFSPSTVISPMRPTALVFTGRPRCISYPAAADVPGIRRARLDVELGGKSITAKYSS
jgi:hypothetical protein